MKPKRSTRKVIGMQKRYYDANSLRRSLDAFEKRFGMTSREFAEACAAGDDDLSVPAFQRHAWLSFHREWSELDGGDDLGSRVEHDLELV